MHPMDFPLLHGNFSDSDQNDGKDIHSDLYLTAEAFDLHASLTPALFFEIKRRDKSVFVQTVPGKTLR